MKAINTIKTIRTTLFHTKSLVIGFLLCWLFPNSVWAYDAYVGGIYYNLNTTDRTAEVTGGNATSPSFIYTGDIDIPASFVYDGITYSVTSIGSFAFEFNPKLNSVTIPNSVTYIGINAFSMCQRLYSVTIGNSVEIIDEGAFDTCTGLNSVTIPNSVTEIRGGVFFDCTGLTTLTIGNSVEIIGDRAFYNCSSLKSIIVSAGNYKYDSRNNCNAIIETATNTLICGCSNTVIPNSVTSIGYEAFKYCFDLTSMEIPNSVTSIGESAFYGCIGLTSMEIPNSVTSIGDEAFRGCTGLTSMEIPNGVTSIGWCSFSECTGLTSVEIPNSVTSIDEFAFNGCTGLTSIEIPNSVTNIVGEPFSGCTGLTYIGVSSNNKKYDSRNNCNAIIETATNALICGCSNTVIPNGVTIIGGNAFYDCTGLTSVRIPSSVTIIGGNAFYGCTGLTSVTIPNGVTSIGYQAFYNCTGLTSIVVESETPPSLDISSHETPFENANKTTLYVPVGSKSAYENALGWNDFENIVERFALATGSCGDNVTYTIYSDMTMVISGTGDMWNYKYSTHINNDYYQSINKLIIEDGVISIGEHAFASFIDLNSVTIGNSVDYIYEGAFENCTNLNSVTIGNSVKYIYEGAFENCTNLNSVTIGNSVGEIGERAFLSCEGLTSVTIPNDVYYIGINAFTGCTSLNSVTIGNSVNTIDDYAFSSCTSLTSLTIPNSVTSLGMFAFSDCTSLTSVTIGNGVTSLDGFVFYECTGLTSVEIPNSVISIGTAFQRCSALTSVTIPSSVTIVGGSAFSNCTSLTSITIPNSVSEIGDYAFAWCYSLNSVTIPNSVTSIGNCAFVHAGLTSVTCESKIPVNIDSNVFYGVDISTCTLYVPFGCKSNYQDASVWCEFGTIVEMEEDDPDTDISAYDNIVYIEGVEAVSSQQVRLSLKMNNTIEATGFQCDVYLPDGVTAAQDEDGFYLMDISEERTTSRKTDYSSSALLPDGGLRFMCSSTRSYTFSGNEGEVAYLIVDIDPDMEGGSYPLILKNVEISDANSNAYRVSYVKTTLNIHILGDANNDGSIGVSDFTAIANYIMGMPPASFIEIAADVNADDVISVSDLTGVANIILYGTVTPNASHAKARNEVTAKYANICAKDVTATTDKEFTVAVTIDGNYAYSGYQFDVTLPEGMSVKNVEGQTKASDVFMSGMIDDNTLRVLCASTMGETTESSVVNLTLVADVEGTYSIDIDNAIVSANASTYTMSNSSFLVGIGNDATGISTLDDESGSNAAVYDLAGKKLIGNGNMSSLQKGIYIVNGKKVTK